MAAVFVLVAVTAPCTAFSQPGSSLAANEKRERQLVDEIRRVQSEQGPHSAALIKPLKALAFLYQDRGDHNREAVAIVRALQIVRTNYGLYSLDQAPLLRQSIRNEEARGDAASAWRIEQNLLTLIKRHRDDLRTVPILREIADERMDLLKRYAAGAYVPQVVWGCYFDPPWRRPQSGSSSALGNCLSGTKDMAIQSILFEAQRYYRDAIGILRRNKGSASPELRELEMNIARSSYVYRRYQAPRVDAFGKGLASSAYQIGRRSLRHLLEDDIENSEPLLNRMKSLVRIADWDLLFKDNGGALDSYEQAYEKLHAGGVPQASTEQLFSPKVPVVLPTFLPNPLASAGQNKAAGYIDVAFDITKFGNSQHIHVLGATRNATRVAKRHLIRLIRDSTFRPRVKDGGFANRTPVVLRYYLTD